MYSAGGPTGEVHEVDVVSGRIGEKLQELLFVEEAELATADKTRIALVSLLSQRMRHYDTER